MQLNGFAQVRIWLSSACGLNNWAWVVFIGDARVIIEILKQKVIQGVSLSYTSSSVQRAFPRSIFEIVALRGRVENS
jgi:hypothetical protein